MLLLQRNGTVNASSQRRTITQQEEQQIHHDAKTHGELQGVLSDVQGLGGNHLACLHRECRQLVLYRSHTGQFQPVEHAHQPTGQRRNDLFQVGAKVQLA